MSCCKRREFTKGFNPANRRHGMAIIAPLVYLWHILAKAQLFKR